MDPLCAARELAALVSRKNAKVTRGGDILRYRGAREYPSETADDRREMSERKAYTAAALDMKTADMTPIAAPGEALSTLRPSPAADTPAGSALPLWCWGFPRWRGRQRGNHGAEHRNFIEKAVERISAADQVAIQGTLTSSNS